MYEEDAPAVQGCPVEWIGGRAFPIAIEYFDFRNLDSIEARARELLHCDGDFKRFIELVVEARERELREEGMMSVISLLWPTRKTFLWLRQIAVAADLQILAGKTGPQMARECGVSKQAFQQGVARFARKLGLRQTRTMRTEMGRENMRLRNSRRRKI